MRDNAYMMTFLIAACVMLLGGITVTGLEIYQYTQGKTPAAGTEVQNSPSSSQPAKGDTTGSPEQNSETEQTKEEGE